MCGCVPEDGEEKEPHWPAVNVEARKREVLAKVECSSMQHSPTWNTKAILKDVRHRYIHIHIHKQMTLGYLGLN